MLRDLGVNAIRLYGWTNMWDHTPFLDMLYNGGIDPIYAALSFWFYKKDLSDPVVRADLKTEFRGMVGRYMDHPAVLMWVIGNELNAHRWYGSSPEELEYAMSLVDELAGVAHEIDSHHPVTTPLDDTNVTGVISTFDPHMKYLDLWSAQLYRGKDFGSFFTDYKAVSSRPVLMTEFGIDAFDDRTQQEDPDTQAEYDVALWNHIVANRNITSGGFVFSYSDEWWKSRESARDDTHPLCPFEAPKNHTNCGHPVAGADGYSNEEWFGLVRVEHSPYSPDIHTPRPVYYAMQKIFNAMAAEDHRQRRFAVWVVMYVTGFLLVSSLILYSIKKLHKRKQREAEWHRMNNPQFAYYNSFGTTFNNRA
eukprot:TRINITY_DN13073_c0_g1_i1.p1 TRINITY_DN13073_c0_g1~~TRINITY_DN13073_c0_g1_i1.p1  ORF type:complete len:364 (+),score=51.79 TRINITY_DN13073_c0_g1_i1:708-1799(+)